MSVNSFKIVKREPLECGCVELWMHQEGSSLEPSKHLQYCEMHKTEEIIMMVDRMNKQKRNKLAFETHISEINLIHGDMIPIKVCIDKMNEFGIIYKQDVDRVAEYLGKTKIGGRWKVYKDRIDVFDYRLFNIAK
jgi:hypothetical protein